MANKVKFKLNKNGVRALLRSSEMEAVCRQYASAVQTRAGEGYEITTYTGKNRVNASVHADSQEALRDTLNNNTLLKALR